MNTQRKQDPYEMEKPYEADSADPDKIKSYPSGDSGNTVWGGFGEELYEDIGSLGDPVDRKDEEPFAMGASGRPVQERKGHASPAADISAAFTDRLALLARAISEINSAMDERNRIAGEALSSLNAEISRLEFLLKEIRGIQMGQNSFMDIRRLNLERLITDLRREARMTRISLWRDMADLRKELLGLTAEHQALLRLRDVWEI